jgi:hypothetical protein
MGKEKEQDEEEEDVLGQYGIRKPDNHRFKH